MIVNVIEGYTHIVGREDGYNGLPLRSEIIDMDGEDVRVMASSWSPSPSELNTLLRGGTVVLRVAGRVHPPVSMDVEPPPEI